MADRELISDIKVVVGIAPVVATDNTALASSIIDTQGFDACAFLIALGTLADVDATFAITLTAGDNSGLSDGAAVGASERTGDTSFIFSDDGLTKKIAYLGAKRYVRCTITPTNNAGNAPICATAVLSGGGQAKPVA